MSQKFVFHAGNSDFVRRNCNAFLASLPDTKSWQVEVRRYRKSRSNNQNATLWMAYKPLMEWMGEQGESAKLRLHEYMCGEFFGTRRGKLGQIMPIRTTTHDQYGQRDVIDAKTFSEFYEMVRRIASENGVYVPDPEPVVPEHARAA